MLRSDPAKCAKDSRAGRSDGLMTDKGRGASQLSGVCRLTRRCCVPRRSAERSADAGPAVSCQLARLAAARSARHMTCAPNPDHR